MSPSIAESQVTDYLVRLSRTLEQIDPKSVSALASALKDTSVRQNTVWIAGNGGSASTASHMAVDLMFGTNFEQHKLKAVALTDNQASITATGNDINFDEIFSRQIEALGRAGDLLIVISASGNSENLLRVVASAEAMGLVTAAIVGFDGGALASRAAIVVQTPTIIGDYGVAEDAHLAVNHVLKELLKSNSSAPVANG
jgi:D-sedoheptulose 7-phosphate isomerase